MTDLEAALEPVREILARRDAARRRGTTPPAPAHLNGAAARPSIDWQLFDQNLAEVRKVVERLRNGAH